MKISNKLSQFERYPALFIASGEYEAHFYIAYQGQIMEKETVKMNPREEAKEKQGFIGKKAGKFDLASVSHKGQYLSDLKKKFQRKTHGVIRSILAESRLEEIYIFAPKYVMARILATLDKEERRKVRMQFYKTCTKDNPMEMIEKFDQEIMAIQKTFPRQPILSI